MRSRINLAAPLAGTCLWACATSVLDETLFTVPPDSLIENITTIAVAPVTTTADFEIPGEAGASLESAVEERLRQAGFSVIPSFEYIGIWQHIADEFGGFFDIHTGERDEFLFDAATKRLRSELRARFEVDAVLFSEFWDGLVPFSDGVAEWDGATQPVFGARNLNGVVRALSLVVVLEDTAGAELYSNGIGYATIEAWHRNAWLPLEIDAVLRDPRLMSRALSKVLDPFVERRLAPSAQVF